MIGLFLTSPLLSLIYDSPSLFSCLLWPGNSLRFMVSYSAKCPLIWVPLFSHGWIDVMCFLAKMLQKWYYAVLVTLFLGGTWNVKLDYLVLMKSEGFTFHVLPDTMWWGKHNYFKLCNLWLFFWGDILRVGKYPVFHHTCAH